MIHLYQVKDERYTTVPNALAQDEDLSWKARGLLLFLLSMPDDWKVRTQHLVDQAPDGRHALSTGLEELEDAGYLRREKRRGDSGEFDGYDFILSSRPIEDWSTVAENLQRTGRRKSPDGENPSTDNPHLQKKQEQKPQRETKETDAAPRTPPPEQDQPNPPPDDDPPPDDSLDDLRDLVEQKLGAAAAMLGSHLTDNEIDAITERIDDSKIPEVAYEHYIEREASRIRSITGLREWPGGDKSVDDYLDAHPDVQPDVHESKRRNTSTGNRSRHWDDELDQDLIDQLNENQGNHMERVQRGEVGQ